MSLVSWATYKRLTGDTTTAQAVAEAAMDDAVALLDDVLNRTLTYGTYTELVKVSPQSHAYPRAIPLVSVSASSSYQIGSPAELRYVTWDDQFDLLDWPYLDFDSAYGASWARALVTYSGGFTEATLPFTLKSAICFLAQGIVAFSPSLTSLGTGSTSTSRTVGDVSETTSTAVRNPAGEWSAVDAIVPGLWQTIKGWRRRTP